MWCWWRFQCPLLLSLYDRARVFISSFIRNAFSCLFDILFYFWLHRSLKKKGNIIKMKLIRMKRTGTLLTSIVAEMDLPWRKDWATIIVREELYNF